MNRRIFIAGLGSTAAWPFVGRAQQASIPVIGVLAYASSERGVEQMPAFRRGLAETGFVDGKNVMLEYRFADYQVDRLPELAAELVDRRVNVIHSTALAPTLAAKAATQTIPISFVMGADPVELGIVASLNRPGGNLTGVTNRGNELAMKRLELLREVTPSTTLFALLVNPTNPISKVETKETEAAAAALGGRLVIISATKPGGFEKAFAELAEHRAGALVVGVDTLFLDYAERIAALVARQGVPAMYGYSRAAKLGGLMSYNTDLADVYRLAGIYAGRILRGEKPADLPIQQSTKVELIVNLKTAKALGLTIPLSLLGRADEVIE